MVNRRPTSGPPILNLALQGGGAHGAFTWGALDCLLDQSDLEIGRVSGTSAGALNAAALVTGLAKGGRQAAKDHLATLWRKIAEAGAPTFLLIPLRKPGMGIWDDAMPLLTRPIRWRSSRFGISSNSVVDVDVMKASQSTPTRCAASGRCWA